ncbi:hypothetical protein WKH59_18680, partial [Acinetobacter baumannii]
KLKFSFFAVSEKTERVSTSDDPTIKIKNLLSLITIFLLLKNGSCRAIPNGWRLSVEFWKVSLPISSDAFQNDDHKRAIEKNST